MAEPAYLPRLADNLLDELFHELPALMITGPRATGKTTSARRLARTVIRLDEETQAALFRANPDAALRIQPEPVLLDEWQAVPGVLGAVKRAIDTDARAGRFLLTGSVRAQLENEMWPATGRVVRTRMFGLTVRETQRAPTTSTFLDTLAAGDIGAFSVPSSPPDLPGYVELGARSGFPDAVLRRSSSARRAWLNGYLDELLSRDVELLAAPRDPARLRRYFEALALNTAGLAEQQTLYQAAGINRATALAYESLLTNLFVLETLPAWSTNRLSRLVKTGKRYLVDPALMNAALQLTESTILGDGNLLGRFLDTFVLAQLRPETEVGAVKPRLYHLRDKDERHEIDVVAEMGLKVVAIEIKATAAPSLADARHLQWLQNALGDTFLAGAVLHTGPRPFALADRIFALPICVFWG